MQFNSIKYLVSKNESTNNLEEVISVIFLLLSSLLLTDSNLNNIIYFFLDTKTRIGSIERISS